MADVTRRQTLALGLGAATALIVGPRSEVFAALGDSRVPDPPPDRPHAGVNDVRARFAALSAQSPIDPEFRAAFIKRKIGSARTHPANGRWSGNAAEREVVDRLGPQAAGLVDQPVPGGVGYGVFYTDAFKVDWGRGTALSFDVVCPDTPGGNVDTWLYLTATNRAALGVEAFVYYYGQTDTRFRVFDWAQSSTNPWQTDIPFSALAEYLAPDAVSDGVGQQLSIMNSTWQIADERYRNEVLLYNHVRHGWDLVYRYDYPATEAQQKTGWIGSWSPIVETFQSPYRDTRPMGALRTLLRSADEVGNWGSWGHLRAAQSYLRTDNQGFELRFVAPNFAFVVIS